MLTAEKAQGSSLELIFNAGKELARVLVPSYIWRSDLICNINRSSSVAQYTNQKCSVASSCLK